MFSGVEIGLAEAAYAKFSASLNPDASSKLAGWVQKTKAGFQYYVPSAAQMTRRMGVDALAHYKDRCVEIERELESIK